MALVTSVAGAHPLSAPLWPCRRTKIWRRMSGSCGPSVIRNNPSSSGKGLRLLRRTAGAAVPYWPIARWSWRNTKAMRRSRILRRNSSNTWTDSSLETEGNTHARYHLPPLLLPACRRRLRRPCADRPAVARWLLRADARPRDSRPWSFARQALRLPLQERGAQPGRYLRSQTRPDALSQPALSWRDARRLERPAHRQPDADAVHVSQVRPIGARDQRPLSVHVAPCRRSGGHP